MGAFARLWYEREQRRTWRETRWFGVPAQQCPLDAWVYQELIWENRPDLVVEVGVKSGGTTLFLATVMEAAGCGRVIGIDRRLEVDDAARRHPLVTLLECDSLDPSLHARLAKEALGRRTLVLLDGDHAAAHVLQELNLYSEYIHPGGYLVVNDTAINGHPVMPGWGEGPFEAVQEFLAAKPPFEVDRTREKHMLTLCPMGFLRRLPESQDLEQNYHHDAREQPPGEHETRPSPVPHRARRAVGRKLAALRAGSLGSASGPRSDRRPAFPSVVISFPKSGKTWLSYLYVCYAAHHLLSSADADAFVDRFLESGFSYNPQAEDPFVDLLARPENEHARIPAVQFAHSFPTSGDVPYFRADPRLAKLAAERAVFLVRDPRDILVSYFHHAKTKGKIPLAADVDASEFVRSECLGVRAVVTYLNKVCEQGPDAFEAFDVVFFEDLVADPIAMLPRVLYALGVEDVRPDAVAAAVRAADFQTLQNADRQTRLLHGKDASPAALRFRRGEVGSFRDELTSSDIVFINGVIDHHLTPRLARYHSREA